MSFRLFFIRASPPLMLSYLFPRLSCDVTAYIPPPEQTYLAETYQTIVDNHWRNIHLETCTCSFHQGLGINYCHRRVCTSLMQAMDREGGINPGESKRARSINCLRCYLIVFERAPRNAFCLSRMYHNTWFWYRSTRRYRDAYMKHIIEPISRSYHSQLGTTMRDVECN